MLPELTLYIRQGCHLCDAFLAELQVYNAELFNSVRLVDVDETAADCQAFGDKVPILFMRQTEVCRYFFDADRIESCLKL
jgi:thioredoxin reductase (NADPH)